MKVNKNSSLIKNQQKSRNENKIDKINSLPDKIIEKNDQSTNALTHRSSNKFDNMIERFKEIEKNKNKKIKEMKARFEEEELSHCTVIPTINKPIHNKNNKEDFLNRTETYKRIYEEKMRNLYLEETMRKMQETQTLYKTNKKLKKSEIDQKINNWIKIEREKQEIISLKQKESQELIVSQCTFQPEIGKKSKKIINELEGQGIKHNIVQRLYRNLSIEDIKRKGSGWIIEDEKSKREKSATERKQQQKLLTFIQNEKENKRKIMLPTEKESKIINNLLQIRMESIG